MLSQIVLRCLAGWLPKHQSPFHPDLPFIGGDDGMKIWCGNVWQTLIDIDSEDTVDRMQQLATSGFIRVFECSCCSLLFLLWIVTGDELGWRCVHLLLLVHTFESCLQKCRMNRLQGLSSWDVCHIPLFTYHRFRDLGSGLQPRWWDILIKDSCNPTIPLSGWLWRIFYSDLCYLELW